MANDEEKKSFKESYSKYSKVYNIIEQANKKGISAGISRNKDGSFSARSKIGKEIRDIKQKYIPIKNSLASQVNELSMLPRTKWEEFNSYITNAKSFFWSLLSWYGTLIYYYKALGVDVVNAYTALGVNFFREDTDKLIIKDGDMQMVAVATFMAISSYFIFSFIFKNSAEDFTPIPDEVTLDNVDSY